jgi:hypothetical protein
MDWICLKLEHVKSYLRNWKSEFGDTFVEKASFEKTIAHIHIVL